MKRNYFFLPAFFCFILSTPVIAQSTDMPGAAMESHKLDWTIIFGAGNTFPGHSLQQTYGDGEAEGINRYTANAIIGFQVRTTVTEKLKLGVEMNFSHWLNEVDENKSHPMAIDQNVGFCYHGLNMLGLMEFKLSKLVRLQTGFGMYTTLIIDSQYGSKYGGSSSLFMMAPGVEIPWGENKSIPISLRLSSIKTLPGNFGTGTGPGTMNAISLVSGINFKS